VGVPLLPGVVRRVIPHTEFLAEAAQAGPRFHSQQMAAEEALQPAAEAKRSLFPTRRVFLLEGGITAEAARAARALRSVITFCTLLSHVSSLGSVIQVMLLL
jgi:hypothetical protein